MRTLAQGCLIGQNINGLRDLGQLIDASLASSFHFPLTNFLDKSFATITVTSVKISENSLQNNYSGTLNNLKLN